MWMRGGMVIGVKLLVNLVPKGSRQWWSHLFSKVPAKSSLTSSDSQKKLQH